MCRRCLPLVGGIFVHFSNWPCCERTMWSRRKREKLINILTEITHTCCERNLAKSAKQKQIGFACYFFYIARIALAFLDDVILVGQDVTRPLTRRHYLHHFGFHYSLRRSAKQQIDGILSKMMQEGKTLLVLQSFLLWNPEKETRRILLRKVKFGLTCMSKCGCYVEWHGIWRYNSGERSKSPRVQHSKSSYQNSQKYVPPQ